MLQHSREHGLLAQQEHRLLSRILRLQHTPIAQVMTPREQIVGVLADATAADIEQRSLHTGRSRLVVTDPDGEQILGVVHVHTALRATARSPHLRAADLMTEPLRLDGRVDATPRYAPCVPSAPSWR